MLEFYLCNRRRTIIPAVVIQLNTMKPGRDQLSPSLLVIAIIVLIHVLIIFELFHYCAHANSQAQVMED